MARTTHVKKAQQRYKTVPTLDAEGKQVVVPVLRKDGEPKMTRSKPGRPGRPITRRLTHEDKTQPLPNRKCGKCGDEIKPGMPYKWIKPKSGPYGGSLMVRCGLCPGWQVWEYSSSLSARLAQVSFDFSSLLGNCDSPDEVTEALSGAAESVREIAQEKQDGADNMESGFGHATSQSEELADLAQSLESWADDIENADVPELPEPEEEDCETCGGLGEVEKEEAGSGDEKDDPEFIKVACDECDGAGTYTPDEPTEDQMDTWRSEVEDACSIVDECPV